MGLGGTKLARSSPWQSKSAIHSTTTFHQSLHVTSWVEAIAAPQVCYRHCYTPFPISGCDKWWYLYRRGSVLPVSTDKSAELYFHAWWCAQRRMRLTGDL